MSSAGMVVSRARACGSCADQRNTELRYVTPQQARELKSTEFWTYQGSRIELSNGQVWWELARCACLHKAAADDVARRCSLPARPVACKVPCVSNGRRPSGAGYTSVLKAGDVAEEKGRRLVGEEARCGLARVVLRGLQVTRTDGEVKLRAESRTVWTRAAQGNAGNNVCALNCDAVILLRVSRRLDLVNGAPAGSTLCRSALDLPSPLSAREPEPLPRD